MLGDSVALSVAALSGVRRSRAVVGGLPVAVIGATTIASSARLAKVLFLGIFLHYTVCTDGVVFTYQYF